MSKLIVVRCGQVGLEVAVVNEDGLRGTVAARDFMEGDTLPQCHTTAVLNWCPESHL